MNAPRVAIYTAIYGSYEATARPLPADLPCPAYLFTDSMDLGVKAEQAGWHAIFETEVYDRFIVDPANGDPTVTRPMLAHKWFKAHPIEAMHWAHVVEAMHWAHVVGEIEREPVEVSIWLDGNMAIKGSGQAFVDRCLAALGDDDWSVMRHPFRDCIYTEAEYTATVCAYRYDAAAIRRQAAAYEQAPWSHPRGWGLPATGHMVRRHTGPVQAAGEDWWTHNLQYSHQDQLSLPVVFAIWADELRFNYDVPWGELWELHPHGS